MTRFHMTATLISALAVSLISPSEVRAHDPDDGDPTPWSSYSGCFYAGGTEDELGSVNICSQFSIEPKAPAGDDASESEASEGEASEGGPAPVALTLEESASEDISPMEYCARRGLHCVWHNAIELDLGRAKVDVERPTLREIDVSYFTVGYRRYFYQKESKYRFTLGVGVGVYDEETTEFGYHAKGVFGISLAQFHNIWVELGSAYHRLESDLDFVNVFIGFRVHAPGRRRDAAQE